jgi:aromatic amino acid transport protein AroP
MATPLLMFSFGGLELIGITAAEADDPSHSIPRATNQAIYRILIFYIGALGVLLSLYPWQKVAAGGSPFVLIFHALNSDVVANVLNLVVLTAAMSVYNSGVYANSRMLYGLAAQGNAPRALLKVNRRGVPVLALAVSAITTGVCVCINYFMPGEAFGMLMGLATSALVINWGMISWIHLRFRAAKRAEGVATAFPSPAAPWSTWLCIGFLAAMLVIMLLTPELRVSVYLIPAWMALLGIGYWLRQRRGVALPDVAQAG